jgi:hypothetical protein
VPNRVERERLLAFPRSTALVADGVVGLASQDAARRLIDLAARLTTSLEPSKCLDP